MEACLIVQCSRVLLDINIVYVKQVERNFSINTFDFHSFFSYQKGPLQDVSLHNNLPSYQLRA